MTRTSNDTGRALEYVIAEEFSNAGFTFGPLAITHQQNYAPYFNALPTSQQSMFESAAENLLRWFLKEFPNTPKVLDSLPDNSGSVVDLTLGSPNSNINLSIKHNHLALRHNRPHGLPNRCEVSQSHATEYLEHLYRIELEMRKSDPATHFRNMVDKPKWMKLINENARKFMEKWAVISRESVPAYFGYLTSNDSPYYKIEVGSNFPNKVYIHEFLGNKPPKSLSISFNSLDYLVLSYDNGWTISKRLHNASSRIDHLSSSCRSSTSDWKWDVQLISQPNKRGYPL
jgi:hypothetical protein